MKRYMYTIKSSIFSESEFIERLLESNSKYLLDVDIVDRIADQLICFQFIFNERMVNRDILTNHPTILLLPSDQISFIELDICDFSDTY